jgi:hypothetical protein
LKPVRIYSSSPVDTRGQPQDAHVGIGKRQATLCYLYGARSRSARATLWGRSRAGRPAGSGRVMQKPPADNKLSLKIG